MTGHTDFCRNLAWAIAARGWTTADLADRVGPAWNTKHSSACRRIRRYLSGVQSPKLDTVELFAQLLHIPPEDLAFGYSPEYCPQGHRHDGTRATVQCGDCEPADFAARVEE